jgi:Asp-tRNA(Asn)/Glu-tRNA(Gln) amidotransferase A subunit family amidase
LTTNLTSLSAVEMAQFVRAKQVSPVELISAHLRRIEQLQPRLNAFVTVDADRALRRAVEAEAALMHEAELPPLFGVPVSIKSSIDVAGLRCEAGSRLRAGYVALSDAPLVARLKRAGAIVVGNTNTPELLMAYETDNVLSGRTSNPWGLQRTPGGSSGGESAAIAAGCVAAGVGSDGGGSIRVPAHFTGICGLKPTPGRIPGTQHFPACVGPFAFLGVVGPMARTIEDLRILLRVMSGHDPGDPMSANFAAVALDRRTVCEIRIGCLMDEAIGAVSAETRAAVHAAATTLESAGLAVERVQPAGLEEAGALWRTLFCEAGAMLVRSVVGDRTTELSPMLARFLATFPGEPPMSGERLLMTLVNRDLLRARFLQQMESWPVLLMPVASGPAFRHGEGGWSADDPVNYLEAMRFTQWFNLLGFPAVVVPVTKSAEGLPIGVQVVGRPFEEEVVLEVAAVIEESFGWKSPPMTWASEARTAAQ